MQGGDELRKTAFVVFGIDNEIIDRFNIDIMTDIQGVGFKLKLSTIDGDIESIVTKVVQDKQDVKFKIHFINHAYTKSDIIEQWLEKHSTPSARLALEYSDGIKTRYTEGKVIDLSKTEKDEYDRLVRDCVFKPLTPFFSHISNTIRIENSTAGKSYPFRYPYRYGRQIVKNNEINNSYILDVPVTIKLFGNIANPTISLIDDQNTPYNTVRFGGLTLGENDYLIINSADRKIWLYTHGAGIQDASNLTDPEKDTFLRAVSGLSKISVNLETSDSGYLIGSWRQYGL